MKTIITDGASAVGEIAYKLSEVIPIYPITPSSPIAEYCSRLNSKGCKNTFNEDVKMIEMQSEAGVAGTLHGALLAHSFSSTFTSSQGLLLMLPNMFKIAGEGLPGVIHVAARSIASHALSIFCDHSDVMATRSTGFAILNACTVQECHHMSLAAHTLAMKTRVPVLHFFDGFRTSHEIQKISIFEDNEIKSVIKNYFEKFKEDYEDKQFGTAQNPDTFFQNRERNQYKYNNLAKDLQEVFHDINNIAGTNYDIFEYYGSSDAEHIIVSMASSCTTIEEYIDKHSDKKIGLIKIRLYRPFYGNLFLEKLPKTTQVITVLDRTKENGAIAPLALDVIGTLQQNNINIKLLYGRYGLGGKDFTADHVEAIYENMSGSCKNNFTVGINDDLYNSNLPVKETSSNDNNFEIKIFGLGSDGSVSASKSTIKILGENYNKYVQGYFEYDSKKSGSLTISHLRLSDYPIKSEYLLNQENVVSINNFSFVQKYDCLKGLKQNGVVLINSIFTGEEIDRVLPKNYVETLKTTNSKLFIINAQQIAKECGLGAKINIIMQTALFKCANLLNKEDIEKNISKYISSMFASKGEEVVNKNIQAMKLSLDKIVEVDVKKLKGKEYKNTIHYNDEFYKDVMHPIANLDGNNIPVSTFSEDGSTPLGTSKLEKRNIALRLPKWIKENCIQCGQCVLACPHSALRAILVDENIENKDNFIKAIGLNGSLFKILLSPEDCTGCGVCAKTCPAIKKALEMSEASEILDEKKLEYSLTENLPLKSQTLFSEDLPKGLQFKKSLFEFPGACAGCGETPYLKILSMLNGSNMTIANATGCSSIYSGTYGSCPYSQDEEGKGTLWANSLFEDNAEFGLGLKLGSNFTKNKDKNVWIIGGDGWAYDIGFGGLDHILASGENVNILVLDNQTYSNTGGQQSKATPTGASVKFAENGKKLRKKDLGQIALTYKDVFVGQISLGANMTHTIKTLKAAQEYEGVSIVIAYAPCVNQGYDMSNMTSKMKSATDCGFWPIYVYDPKTKKLTLSSNLNEEKYFDFLRDERRFSSTIENNNEDLLESQKQQAIETYNILKNFN